MDDFCGFGKVGLGDKLSVWLRLPLAKWTQVCLVSLRAVDIAQALWFLDFTTELILLIRIIQLLVLLTFAFEPVSVYWHCRFN